MHYNGTVYLAGPITGLMLHDTMAWRDYVAAQLARFGIRSRSPVRYLDHLKKLDREMPSLPENEDQPHPLRTSKAITTRDRFDLLHSDVMFVNFMGTTRASIGTCIEFGWADAHRIPVVVAMEPGSIHDHGMIREITGFIGSSLEEAIEITKSILMTDPLMEPIGPKMDPPDLLC